MGPTFTQTLGGPAHKSVWHLICRAGDTLALSWPDHNEATYLGTGRHTENGYWEALYLDPEEHREWRVLKESRLEELLSGGPTPLTTLRGFPFQVCLLGDDGSTFRHRGALSSKVLGILPSGLLTSSHDHANGWTHGGEQVRLSQVPTRMCGDYEAKALQTQGMATASRSAAGLDRGVDRCYAQGLGVFEGGWRGESPGGLLG